MLPRRSITSSLSFALVLAPFALACSAGGGNEPAEVQGPSGGAGTVSPTFNDGPTFVPTVPAGNNGANLGGVSNEEDPECDNVLDIVYRDFDESHPDFEMPDFSGDVVRLNLVQPNLGTDSKPVFRDSIGCPMNPQSRRECANWDPERPSITSATTFDQWYRTTPGVNVEIAGTLVLEEPEPNRYVYDSTAFFPIGPEQGLGVTPANNNPGGRNFLFTSEIHVNFTYEAGQRFTFRGDDDLWIFVNNKLALDLGSMHGPEEGTIDFDALADFLNIVPGRVYPMDIFHAERHTTGSNFRFETNITCFVPSILR